MGTTSTYRSEQLQPVVCSRSLLFFFFIILCIFPSFSSLSLPSPPSNHYLIAGCAVLIKVLYKKSIKKENKFNI